MDYAIFVMLISAGAFILANRASKRVGKTQKTVKKRHKEAPEQPVLTTLTVIIVAMVVTLPLLIGIPPWLGVICGAIFLFWRLQHVDTDMDDDDDVVDPFEHPDGLSADEAKDESFKAMLNIIQVVCVWAFTASAFAQEPLWGVLFAVVMLYWGYRHVDYWFYSKYQQGEHRYLLIHLHSWYYIVRSLAISIACGLLYLLQIAY